VELTQVIEFTDLRLANELPSIDDLLKLRLNLQTMRVLCNNFLPCVVGKKRWKMQILAGKKVNEIATVSDKAFVLLVLENIWDDMMNLDIDDYYHPRKRTKSNNAENNKTSTTAKSTADTMDNNDNRNGRIVVTGQWTSAWRGSRRYGGWSPEGIDRFNRLVKIVKQDRDNDTHFQAQYEIWLNESKRKKTKEKVKQPLVKAYRDLSALGV